MNAQFLVFFTVFLSVYSLANFYVGLRGWQAFHSLPAFPGGRFYSAVFILVAFAYILERILGDYLPGPLNTLLQQRIQRSRQIITQYPLQNIGKGNQDEHGGIKTATGKGRQGMKSLPTPETNIEIR